MKTRIPSLTENKIHFFNVTRYYSYLFKLYFWNLFKTVTYL